MNGFDFVFWIVKGFVLSHLVPILIIGVVVALFFVPGFASGTIAVLRTTIGKILLACALSLIIGWEARSFLDDSLKLGDQLRTERAAAADQHARDAQTIAQQQAAAAEARRQAEAQHAIAESAAAREHQARNDAETLQEQVDDYAQQLADAGKTSAGRAKAVRCALSDADARRLLGIGPTQARAKR